MNQQQQLVEIGRGNCGSVWAKRLSDDDVDVVDEDDIMPSETVIKREDGGLGRSITKEHDIHKHILARLAATATATQSKSSHNLITGYQVNIPTPIDFITSDSSEWDSLLPRLPKDSNGSKGFQACRALRNERIPPMPQPIRQLLAQKYIGGRGPQDDEEFAATLLDAVNKEQNFLVRPFLGRRRQPRSERPMRRFSLRNFLLHLDQIEELGLPVEEYAMAMADTLAFLHWEAEVDAADVEFVLARPRSQQAVSCESSSPPPSIGSKPFLTEGVLGPHAMWLLDFDCCRKMIMPGAMKDGEKMQTEIRFLKTAAKGFWGNDPWYPRPPPDSNTTNGGGNSSNSNNHGTDSESDHHLADRELWEKFKGRYLETSEEILERKEGREKGERVRELPGKVMEMIERTRGKRSTWFDQEDEREVE